MNYNILGLNTLWPTIGGISSTAAAAADDDDDDDDNGSRSFCQVIGKVVFCAQILRELLLQLCTRGQLSLSRPALQRFIFIMLLLFSVQ